MLAQGQTGDYTEEVMRMVNKDVSCLCIHSILLVTFLVLVLCLRLPTSLSHPLDCLLHLEESENNNNNNDDGSTSGGYG